MKTETKKTETKTREVVIPFRGKDYRALANGKELVGLIGSMPPMPTKDWLKAVKAALGE